MEYAASKAGAEGMSFPTIIAAGGGRPCPRAGFGRSRSRRLDSWSVTSVLYSLVIVRTGPALYTWGVPTEARRRYDAVREAQQAAVEHGAAWHEERMKWMAQPVRC